jgi:hypothetical protein
MADMYQLVRDVCHQKISKWAAKNLLVKKLVKVLNNHSTSATNNSSLENVAWQGENRRSQNTESRKIHESNTLSGRQREMNKSAH